MPGHDSVQELLHILNVPVNIQTLTNENMTGSKLAGLTEQELARLVDLKKIGDIKRLKFQLEMLNNGDGFLEPQSPGVLGWDTESVCNWLDDNGFSGVDHGPFIRQNVDGVALLRLLPVDLDTLGVRASQDRARLMEKVADLTRGSRESADGTDCGAGKSCEGSDHKNGILDAVLAENSSLQQQLEEAQSQYQSQDVPDDFRCPITLCVMTDPVFCMDGNTYERAAIESWFKRNHTSPLSGTSIPKTLVPNLNLRRQISAYEA